MVLQLTRWPLVRFGLSWGLILPSLVNVSLLATVTIVGHARLRL